MKIGLTWPLQSGTDKRTRPIRADRDPAPNWHRKPGQRRRSIVNFHVREMPRRLDVVRDTRDARPGAHPWWRGFRRARARESKLTHYQELRRKVPAAVSNVCGSGALFINTDRVQPRDAVPTDEERRSFSAPSRHTLEP